MKRLVQSSQPDFWNGSSCDQYPQPSGRNSLHCMATLGLQVASSTSLMKSTFKSFTCWSSERINYNTKQPRNHCERAKSQRAFLNCFLVQVWEQSAYKLGSQHRFPIQSIPHSIRSMSSVSPYLSISYHRKSMHNTVFLLLKWYSSMHLRRNFLGVLQNPLSDKRWYRLLCLHHHPARKA